MPADTFVFLKYPKPMLRDWNALTGAWAVCGNAACRRARACRKDVRLCMPGHFARLPDGVQRFFEALAAVAEEDEPSAEEAMARLAKTPCAEAFVQWRASLPGAELGAQAQSARVLLSPGGEPASTRTAAACVIHQLRAHRLKGAIAATLRAARHWG